jgi:hypothetical protein
VNANQLPYVLRVPIVTVGQIFLFQAEEEVEEVEEVAEEQLDAQRVS